MGEVRKQKSALPRHLYGKRPPRKPQDRNTPDAERDVLPDRVLVESDPRPAHLELPVRLRVARACGQHPLFDQERTLSRLLDLPARDLIIVAADPDGAVVEDSRLRVEVDRDPVERELLVRVFVSHLPGQVRLSRRRIVPDPVGTHRPGSEFHFDVPLRQGDSGLLVVGEGVGGHVNRGVETDPRFRELLQGRGNGKTYLRGDVRYASEDKQEADGEATETIQGMKPTRCR